MATPSAINTMFDKLNTLLTKDLKNILKKELHNENRVNLYGVGEYWVAFEKSAYLLEQMIQEEDEPVVLHIKGYPFPVMMHNIHYHRVDDMCRKHIMAKKGLEFLSFVTKPIDDSSYSKWYREYVVEEIQ